MARLSRNPEGADEAAPPSHRGFSLSNRTREWIAGLSLRAARRARALDIRRRPDGAVAEPRLFFGQRLWRIFLRRSRQLSPDARRSAVLAQLAGHGALHRPAGALALCDGPGPRAAGAKQHPLQRLRAHYAVHAADRQPGRRGLVWQVLLVDKIGLLNQFTTWLHLGQYSWLGDPQLCAFRRRLHQRLVPDGILHADISRRPAGHSARNITRRRGSTAPGPVQSFLSITLPLLQPTSFFVFWSRRWRPFAARRPSISSTS